MTLPKTILTCLSLSCFSPLALFAIGPTPADIQQYNGAAFGTFPVEYPSVPSGQANAIKLFAEYNLGDIEGELDYLQQQNVNQVKTYAHFVWAAVADYSPGISEYISQWNTINENPTSPAAKTALAYLNNPYQSGMNVPAGTRWIIPMAAAKGMEIFATANVTSGTLASSPAGMPASVDLKYREGGQERTITVALTGLNLPGGYTSYTSAHWDIELALWSIVNDRLSFSQPTSSTGGYGISVPGKKNRDFVKALIIGNEVLSTANLTVTQVENLIKFAKNRRDAYGLNAAELPITTDTNSLGNWQRADMVSQVLPLIETYIFFNTYGMPFTSFNFTNQASPTFNPPTTTPAKTAGENVINNISAFQAWLSGTSYSSLTIVVGEHGYPSSTAVSDPTHVYSTTNAAAYYCGDTGYDGVLKAIAEKQVLCFFFEAFDEPWKDTTYPDTGTENHWGIATVGQSNRRVLNTPFDPSSYEPWQFPQTYAQKANYCNPLIPAPTTDSDGDGLTDNFEAQIIRALEDDAITDYSHVTPGGDFDGDGLTEAEEQYWGTSAILRDSDGDVFTDKAEVDFGSDPTNADSLPIAQEIMTAVEFRFSTLPGYLYQVQYSENLEDWNNLEPPVIGDGETHSLLISFEGRLKSSEHYRIVVTEVPPG